MPGSSRSCFSSMRATGSAHALIVSAAERYARILKRFSPLISSRSAIPEKICAIGWLSTPQAVPLDGVVQQPRPSQRQRLSDGRAFRGWSEAKETPAPAGATHLGRDCAGCFRPRDQTIDDLSLIHISEPTRLLSISYAVFCL